MVWWVGGPLRPPNTRHARTSSSCRSIVALTSFPRHPPLPLDGALLTEWIHGPHVDPPLTCSHLSTLTFVTSPSGWCSQNKYTALMWACYLSTGTLETVMALVDAGAEINTRNSYDNLVGKHINAEGRVVWGSSV